MLIGDGARSSITTQPSGARSDRGRPVFKCTARDGWQRFCVALCVGGEVERQTRRRAGAELPSVWLAISPQILYWSGTVLVQ
jgi:hypothetical protein